MTGPDGIDYRVDPDGEIDCPETVADALRAAWADQYSAEAVHIANADTLAVHPTEHTVDELRDALADIDDPDDLRAARVIETDTQDRETALEAIDDRLAKLEG